MSENGTSPKQNSSVEDLSFQQRIEETQGGAVGGVFYFSKRAGVDEDVAPWWSAQRDRDLREFTWRTGNDILQGAVSTMVKKIKSTGWYLEGGQRLVSKYQPLLAEAEFGQGWGDLLSKVIIDYCTQDKGGFIELIGEGDPLGPIQGSVLGIAHLDSGLCQLTGDPTYPVLFYNSKDDKPHKLHATRVAHIVDMPSPIEAYYGTGFCAVSRVISSSQVLLKLQQYKNEKLSDLPPAGMLLMNNILPQKWDDARANYKQERRRRGQELWTNVMTLFGLDPAQPTTAEFLSFADLPEHFNERDSIDLYINILALAFGVDVREFWPISGGSLGTATETEVMHQKAKGKGPGEIYSAIERVINWKVLPPTVTFGFDYKDDEEDELRAKINETITKTILEMFKSDNEERPASRLEIRQMLADHVEYFSEEFLQVDITEDVEVTDTEREKMWGRKVKMYHDGTIKPVKRKGLENVDRLLDTIEQNYKEGLITLDQVIDFRIGDLLDGGNR